MMDLSKKMISPFLSLSSNIAFFVTFFVFLFFLCLFFPLADEGADYFFCLFLLKALTLNPSLLVFVSEGQSEDDGTNTCLPFSFALNLAILCV